MAMPCPIFLVPVMGKTGTTSDFRGALFVGSYWFNKHKEHVQAIFKIALCERRTGKPQHSDWRKRR